MLSTEAFLQISREVGAPVSRVETTVALLEGGATVPFIARYRKEATGNLDEVKIQDIDERRAYYTALDQRRETVLSTIERQGKLTEELKQKILLCFNKNELEDIYLPYKPKRRTKAATAIERGLGPLAEYIWEQTGTEPVEVFAFQFVSLPEPAPEPAQESLFAPPAADPGAAAPVATEEAVQTAAAEAAPPVAAPPEGSAEGTPAGEAAPAPPPPEAASEEKPQEEVAAAKPQEHPEDKPQEHPEAKPQEHPEDKPQEHPEAKPQEHAEDKKEAKVERAPQRVEDVVQAIEGALHILAERVSENPAYRRQLREKLLKTGVVRAKVVEGKESEKTKYEMYYKFEETVTRIPSHRMLAIRRGTRENVLTYSIETDGEGFIQSLLPQIIKDAESQFAPYLSRAIRDGYERLMFPSIQNEVRSMLRERSEAEAIRVFEENLRTLLLSPPAGPIGVMGVDPGIRTGCKIAVVDSTGKFLENQTIHLSDPHKDLEGAEKILTELVQKHNVRAITIGNGTASRETESFVRSMAQKNAFEVFVVVVSEAGASVYSASKRAREEFPNLDVTIRGAISIARRLQDPLAELVKIEPRSIGVGQYQHDVDQKKLKHGLETAVQSCVNRVGVDLNTASEDLLKYVSGINDRLAGAIIAHRSHSGAFRSRTQLMEVDGFGDKTFEQSAGFLRIKGGDNPLDRTAVHPESYSIVERIAASLGVPVADLIENAERVNAIDFKGFEAEAGKFTIADIREELLRPGRDPRDKFVAPQFREDVKEVVDLQEGMELEGRVTNVTNFGAFVDLGVHQDGLVHISELSHKYVQDAREAVKVGDVVKVKVIGVDTTMKRISLSMKALLPKPPRPPRKRRAPQRAVAAAPQAGAAGGGPGPAKPERPAAASASRPPEPRPARRPQPENRPPRSAPPARISEGRPPRSDRPQRPASEVTRPAPSHSASDSGPQTMEEKIRLLQEKFGRVG